MNPFDNFFCSFYPRTIDRFLKDVHRIEAALKTETSAETGLGSSGIPRRGKPKTEPERLATHQEKYGNSKLPLRGTGLAG